MRQERQNYISNSLMLKKTEPVDHQATVRIIIQTISVVTVVMNIN